MNRNLKKFDILLKLVQKILTYTAVALIISLWSLIILALVINLCKWLLKLLGIS